MGESIIVAANKILYETMKYYPDYNCKDFVWVLGREVRERLEMIWNSCFLPYEEPLERKFLGIKVVDELVGNPNALCLIPRESYERSL